MQDRNTGNVILRRRYEGGKFKTKVSKDLIYNVFEEKVNAEQENRKKGQMPSE